MRSFPTSLISMFRVRLKTGAEVTFPVREPTTKEKEQFGTKKNTF